ncbi:phosphoadenosine phosphosulfate reductase family protein [Flaviaesturariibacter amylovorans]|uniref:Phosphoadenosine phosphosulphate reductase domain-containing protein n=1 Tax=Flaviaesturariibacter amylovorans TaxID=1084520 RepID=A0ABP8GR55_9BACT
MTLVINFSGGKDSCAMLAYLCERYPDMPKRVVFADTGWEHPGTEQWCRDMVRQISGLELDVCRNPNKTLLTMAERRGKFPGMQTRQCTSDLKRGPIETWIRRNVTDPVVISCMGIRSEESTGRKRLSKLRRIQQNSKRTVWQWNPIKDWTEVEVLAYLSARSIPLHPVYQHLRRFSCRVCIYMTVHDLRQVDKHDPEAVAIIDGIEQQIGFTMFQGGPIRDVIAGRTKGQTELFDPSNDPAQCV